MSSHAVGRSVLSLLLGVAMIVVGVVLCLDYREMASRYAGVAMPLWLVRGIGVLFAVVGVVVFLEALLALF
ncbi:hypothetical protein SAMN05892883_1510 [Jatrophihabitans sp. GAS493]|uniref:hypothetical protein n=1 Tax=Jatrophihabitans sp. GAS493 TaxID=1907575 RepID=UPI000BB9BBF8|nr:hypothetical protein [Jatrophihabitans sp. GAS493]SOD72076.1 hypothetical protein SAMN05892883_1510 [Jatrophihabitans sp. GAS493]